MLHFPDYNPHFSKRRCDAKMAYFCKINIHFALAHRARPYRFLVRTHTTVLASNGHIFTDIGHCSQISVEKQPCIQISFYFWKLKISNIFICCNFRVAST